VRDVSSPVPSNARGASVDERVDVLVLGAGATGLGTAAFFREAQQRGGIPADRRLVVVEAEAEPGGYCRTIRQDGFVFDYAGHFFHFRDPAIHAFVAARLPPGTLREVTRRAAVVDVEGCEVPYPYQGHLRALPRDAARRCLVDLWHAERSPSSSSSSPASFKAWARQRLGRGLCDRFVVPYNEKLYATDLDQLDADCMGRFFPTVRFDEVIAAVDVAGRGYNATFTWPDDGAITYIHALQRDLDPADLRLSERVVAVDLERRIVTTTKRRIACGAIVSSVPLPRLLALVTPMLFVDPAAFSWNRVLVFNLGFDRKGRDDVHWLYVARPDVPFYRVGFYDVIAGGDRMSLYLEVGLPSSGEVDVDGLRAACLDGLRRLGIVTQHRLVSQHHVLMDPAYVHLTPSGMAATSTALAALERHGVYSVGRYGAWTYCSIEDNLRQARALVEGPLRAAAIGA
jgi:protoporphyrinogen oxidase